MLSWHRESMWGQGVTLSWEVMLSWHRGHIWRQGGNNAVTFGDREVITSWCRGTSVHGEVALSQCCDTSGDREVPHLDTGR